MRIKVIAMCMILALLAIGSTAQVIAAAAVVPFTEKFDSVSAQKPSNSIPMPTGWSSSSVIYAQDTSAAVWEVKDNLFNPTIVNYSDDNSVRFNSNLATAGNTARLEYTGVFDFTGYSTLELSFEMSHDVSVPAKDDSIQWQYKTGSSWTNIGTAKTRYQSGDAHWDKETVDFSSLIGQTNVTLGLLGTSRHGNNIFIDNISLTGKAVPEASTLVGFGSSLAMAAPGIIGWLRRRRAYTDMDIEKGDECPLSNRLFCTGIMLCRYLQRIKPVRCEHRQ